MMGRDWKSINNRIKECRRLYDSEKILNCLENLFMETNDGMVAFALGEEYEKSGRIDNAIQYYGLAATLFPLKDFKNRALDSKRRLELKMESQEDSNESEEVISDKEEELIELDPIDTLIIVSCTKTKVWDIDPTSPDYVIAKSAYKGKPFLDFLEWAKENQIEKKGFNWIILSGKYGFIEPWHPISRYDVHLAEPDTFPVSELTLKNQIYQARWWRSGEGNLKKVILSKFHDLIVVNLSPEYLEVIKNCFPDATIKLVYGFFAK